MRFFYIYYSRILLFIDWLAFGRGSDFINVMASVTEIAIRLYFKNNSAKISRSSNFTDSVDRHEIFA